MSEEGARVDTDRIQTDSRNAALRIERAKVSRLFLAFLEKFFSLDKSI